MTKKRTLAVLLAASMVLFLAACSGGGATTGQTAAAGSAATSAPAATPAAATPAPATSEPAAELGYPIEGNKTLTYWMGVSVSAYNDNNAKLPMWKAIMESTGVTVEFIHPIVGQEKEGFNLMVAGGDYPDIIESNVTDAGALYDDGVIIDLTDVIPVYAPNLYSYLQANPSIDLQVKNDDGQYLLYPFIRPDPLLQVSSGPIVRIDWLDQLGLAQEDVTTIAEWHDLLVAFREEFGAEVPISFDSNGNFRRLMYAYETVPDFTNENGTVEYGFMRTGYYDWLVEMNKWYVEGILDPNFAAPDRTTLNSNILTGKSGLTYGSGGSYLGVWLTSKPEEPAGFDLGGLRYPVLNEGDINKHGLNVQFEFSNSNGWAMISTDCDDVETAARFLNFGYSEEGLMVYNFGILNESYTIEGGVPTYTQAMFNDPEKSISDTLGFYVRATGSGPFIQDPQYILQYYQTEQQKKALDLWTQQEHKSTKLPPIVQTPEEGSEVTTIMADINTYISEEEVKFVMGTRSLDTFPAFIEQIKSMNIERAIAIKQGAVNRYYDR